MIGGPEPVPGGNLRDEALAEKLLAAASEAHRLAEALTSLDRAIGHAGGIAAPPLQAVDLLRQEAEGLAQFLSALAAAARSADGDPAAATHGLRLRAQVARLSGCSVAAGDAEPVELWGVAAG
ncbi:hypothetical protein [Paracoccus beibuensis]|uniref:hypothetical protein n=1 Tax=Paracoccus beibuensis TaxID=547602 RepID=UPI00223FE814|nr:hypothetical protein [Paracoccus beibuensis]